EVVPTPEIGFHLEDAVVIEAQHHVDSASLRFRKHTIQPPSIVESISDLVLAIPFDAKGVMPHPDADIVDACLLVSVEPIVVIISPAAVMPARAQPIQEERRPIALLKVPLPFLLDPHQA